MVDLPSIEYLNIESYGGLGKSSSGNCVYLRLSYPGDRNRQYRCEMTPEQALKMAHDLTYMANWAKRLNEEHR